MLQRLLLTLCCAAALTACDVGPKDPAPSLQSRWWTWAAAAPSGANPIEDLTGEFCDRNQPADVWFLAGTFGGKVNRRCQIPHGRPIEAPVVNLYSGDPQDCDEFMRTAEGSAKLDGKELTLDRIANESIVITAKSGNPLGESPGTFKATGCGLWVHITPLTPGSHSLQIHGESGDFTVDVDYSLEVLPPTG